jgi:hypothetical protein
VTGVARIVYDVVETAVEELNLALRETVDPTGRRYLEGVRRDLRALAPPVPCRECGWEDRPCACDQRDAAIEQLGFSL